MLESVRLLVDHQLCSLEDYELLLLLFFWIGSGGVPPVALVVDEIGCVGWMIGVYELYDLNGDRTYLVQSPYASPRQVRLQGSLL
jgi:hypothetical protein